MSWAFEFLAVTNKMLPSWKQSSQQLPNWQEDWLTDKRLRGSITRYSKTSSHLLKAQRTLGRLWKFSTGISKDSFVFTGKSMQMSLCSLYMKYQMLHSQCPGYKRRNLGIKLSVWGQFLESGVMLQRMHTHT